MSARRLSALAARAALALVLASAFGCESTGVGNPGFKMVLTKEDSVEPGAPDTTSLDEESLTRAILVIGRFRFLACDGSDEDVVLEGPFVVDLTRSSVDPEIPEIEPPPGGICGIDALLAPARTPRLLQGRSVLFSGRRADGTAFILVGDVPGALRMRPTSPGAFDQGIHRWLWALRPRRWIVPSELEGVNADTGSAVAAVSDALDDANVAGLIVIHSNRHPLLFRAIRSRLAARSTLHLDSNDNSVLDEDELNGDELIGNGIEDPP